MKTVRILISGTVQGVFFRDFIKKKSDKIGLKGFIRNLDDGRAEIIAEGKDEKVNEIINECKKGPAHSNVKNIETQEIKNQGFKEFKILKF